MSGTTSEQTLHVDEQIFPLVSATMSGAQIKALVGKDLQYQLFMEGPARFPDQPIGDTQSVQLQPGMRFYTVPPAVFGASLDPTSRQVQELKRRFDGAEVNDGPDGSRVVTIPELRLPPGWNRDSTRVRFVVPVGFPIARPDSFWTEPGLRLAGGGLPMNTAIQEPWPGQGQFLWFSWHPSFWDPQRDSIVNYVGVIAKRLSEAR